MEVIRNSRHNGRDYIVVDTSLKIEKGEQVISTPVHIRVDVTNLTDRDRAVVFGKVNGIFNQLLTIRNKQQPPVKESWWKTIFK